MTSDLVLNFMNSKSATMKINYLYPIIVICLISLLSCTETIINDPVVHITEDKLTVSSEITSFGSGCTSLNNTERVFYMGGSFSFTNQDSSLMNIQVTSMELHEPSNKWAYRQVIDITGLNTNPGLSGIDPTTFSEDNATSKMRYFYLLDDGNTVGAYYEGIPSDSTVVNVFALWLAGDEIHPSFRRYYYISLDADFVKVDCVGDSSEEFPDTLRVREFEGSVIARKDW